MSEFGRFPMRYWGPRYAVCKSMSPALAMTIDAARDLAWRSHSNLRPVALADRHESHDRMVAALTTVRRGDTHGERPEVRFLLAAIRRAAVCSYASRMGLRYYQRKQAIAELRGCLIAYDRSQPVAA